MESRQNRTQPKNFGFTEPEVFRPARARTQFEAFGFTELGFFTLFQAGRDFFEAFSFTKSKAFRPAWAGRLFLKLSASPFLGYPPNPSTDYFLDLAGPGVGGGSGRAPKPLPALPFLVRRKGSKRLFRGFPPKDPQGERSGRVPLTPTAGILCGRSKHDKRAETRFQHRKILLFVNLYRYRTTAQQPISLVSGAGCPESSACNLSLFRTS